MKIESRQLAEIIGVLAVVLSLMFVGYELRLARSVAESESIAQRIELATSIGEQLTTNSNVWARGCLGEELSPNEAIEFTNIALSLISYEFYRFNRANIGLTEAPILNGPRLVARNVYSFPGFTDVWEKERSGSNEFREAVDEQIDLLVDSGAEKELDVAWCGK